MWWRQTSGDGDWTQVPTCTRLRDTCYISHIFGGKPPINRFDPKLHGGWCPRRNHVCQVSNCNLHGLRFYRGEVEFSIFLLIFAWALQQGGANALPMWLFLSVKFLIDSTGRNRNTALVSVVLAHPVLTSQVITGVVARPSSCHVFRPIWAERQAWESSTSTVLFTRCDGIAMTQKSVRRAH